MRQKRGRKKEEIKRRYDFGIDYDWGKVRLRLNPEVKKWDVYSTGSKGLDNMLGGGLRMGLNLFCGEAGTGKTKMAKVITGNCVREGDRVLYVCAEDLVDNPKRGMRNDNDGKLSVLDYTKYLPMAKKTLGQVLGACEKLEPDLLVIDSLTCLLSGTTKSVEEADIRENVFILAQKVSGVIPVVGISEMRGQGWTSRPAGGSAVYHSANITLLFGKEIRGNEKVWILDVLKDREGLANSSKRFGVRYEERGRKEKLYLDEL